MLSPRKWTAKDVLGLRKKYKLTQSQLAEMLGVAQPRISEWESGRNPSKLVCIALDRLQEVLEEQRD